MILVSIIHEPRSKCSKINLGRSGRKWFITWTERCKTIGPSKRISFKCITNFDFAWPELLFWVSSPEKFQKQSIHVSRRFQTNLSNRNKNWYPQWQPSDKVFDTNDHKRVQAKKRAVWSGRQRSIEIKDDVSLYYIMTILQKMPFTLYQMLGISKVAYPRICIFWMLRGGEVSPRFFTSECAEFAQTLWQFFQVVRVGTMEQHLLGQTSDRAVPCLRWFCSC